jgi:hypothetical protein
MYKLIVCIACIIIALADANKKIPRKSVHLINHAVLDDQWSDFKLKYNKKYVDVISRLKSSILFFLMLSICLDDLLTPDLVMDTRLVTIYCQ